MTSYNNNQMTVLEARYRGKVDKYQALLNKAKTLTTKTCTLTVVVVSSLGILYPKSMKSLHQLLGGTNEEMNKLDRRISTAALIGSYNIFYNIQSKPRTLEEDDLGDMSAEEPENI